MGLITLISDFGAKDYYVALLKAAIFKQYSEAAVVDITHDITRHDIMEAAFYLQSTFDHFPESTIHVVCVNSFYSPKSELIMIKYKGHYFIGPNNGLFSLVFTELSADHIWQISDNLNTQNQYEIVGAAITIIASNRYEELFVQPIGNFDRKISLQPVITSQQIRATIVHIDQFGNVIVNLDQRTFEQVRANRPYAIYYKSNDPITRLSSSYSDSMIGDVCAFFNTINLLEIAINMGNAHELLNLNKNETIQINFG